MGHSSHQPRSQALSCPGGGVWSLGGDRATPSPVLLRPPKRAPTKDSTGATQTILQKENRKRLGVEKFKCPQVAVRARVRRLREEGPRVARSHQVPKVPC